VIGGEVAQSLGVAEGSPQHAKLTQAAGLIWEKWFKPADLDGDGAATLHEWLQVCDIFGQLPSAADEAVETVKPVVEAMDANGDGKVTFTEYSALIKAIGSCTDEEARTGFDKLDRDGNGTLSAEEVSLGWFEYFFTDDPDAPGNWFYGRRF
jgi:juvenile hormone diol kinase